MKKALIRVLADDFNDYLISMAVGIGFGFVLTATTAASLGDEVRAKQFWVTGTSGLIGAASLAITVGSARIAKRKMEVRS